MFCNIKFCTKTEMTKTHYHSISYLGRNEDGDYWEPSRPLLQPKSPVTFLKFVPSGYPLEWRSNCR